MRIRILFLCLALWAPLALSSCHRGVDFRAGMVLANSESSGTKETFRVLTWNVQHFVDPYNSPYIQNEWDDTRQGMSDRRVDLFVEAIRKIDADVVALEEFENSAWLEQLAKTRFPEMGYTHFAAAEELTWHQNVIVMSRFPLGPVTSFGPVSTAIEGETDKDGRPAAQDFTNHRLIAVEVYPNKDYDFLLLALHLKAGGGDRNEGWRLGQIDFLRDWLKRRTALRPDSNVVLVGDLNSEPRDPVIQRLTAKGGPPWVPFVDPLNGENVPTAPSRDPHRRIDFILPNANMIPEYVADSLKPATPLPPEDMREASDHLPVVAEFAARER